MGNVTEEWLNEAGTEKRLYSYNGAGFCTQMTYPGGRVETYTTDYTGMVTGKTDRRGTAFTYTYNAWQNPLTPDGPLILNMADYEVNNDCVKKSNKVVV